MRALFSLPLLLPLLFSAHALAMPVLEEPSFVPGTPVGDEVRAALRDALAAKVKLLGDEIYAPRPAAEAHKRVAEVAKRFAKEAVAQRYLSRVALADGDIAGAETAAQAEVNLARTEPQAYIDLGDFYKGRNQGQKELSAVEKLIGLLRKQLGKGDDMRRRDALRQALERAREVAQKKGLGHPLRFDREIAALYPSDPSYLRRYLDGLLQESAADPAQKTLSAKENGLLKELARLQKQYPDKVRDLIRVEASVYEAHRDADAAIKVYTRALEQNPVPPTTVMQDVDGIYDDLIELLRRRGRDRQLRDSLAGKARAKRLSGLDLALLCQLYLKTGDAKAKTLIEESTQLTQGAVPTAELLLRARLLLRVSSPEAAIPVFYAAYRSALLDKGDRAVSDQREALSDLGHTLLRDARVVSALTPLSPLSAFSLRRVQGGPSIVGGLASFLFNGHVGNDAGGEAEDLKLVSRALANGQRAVEIYRELRKLGGTNETGAGLLADLVDLYREYKDFAEAFRLADEFTATYPRDPRYFDVALSGCDARLRKRTGDGPCYKKTLDEAVRRGDRGAYDRVLQAYVDALTREKKGPEVVRLYWDEINRRGADEALYDRFLSYLTAHNLYDEELKVYEQASKALPGSSFYNRMARYYLKRKGDTAFRDLIRRLLASLDEGTAGRLLSEEIHFDFDNRRAAESAFYLEIYRQAVARFPLSQPLHERLLGYYDRFERHGADAEEGGGHTDSADALRLVKQLSMGQAPMRTRLLQQLGRRGHLDRTLSELAKGGSSAEQLIQAELLIFQSRQEDALPVLAALRKSYPHDREVLVRHAALVRAVAEPTPRQAAQQAAALLEQEFKLFPADEDLIVQSGDYLAEAGLLDDAAQRFLRITQVAPADPEAALRLASIQWDYFLFDQAAASILTARKRSADPLRFADKLAAVYESRKDYGKAVTEYVRLYASEQGGDERRSALRPDEERTYDEDGEGQSFSPEANGTATSSGRLLYLYRRKGQAVTIDRAFRAEYDRDPQAPGTILAYAAHLLDRGDAPGRQRFLLAAIDRLSELPVLQKLVTLSEGRGSADNPIRLPALRRIAVLAQGAPSAVDALASALQQVGDLKGAETERKQLLARLDQAGPDAVGDAIEARTTLARLLFGLPPQQGRRDEAIALLQGAADRAGKVPDAGWSDRLLGEMARWQEQQGKDADAERTMRGLLSRHPAEVFFVDQLGDLLWRRGQKDAVLALYRDQLLLLRPGPNQPPQLSQLSGRKRKDVAQGLRRRLVDRYRDAGRTREAVDLWIEAVHATPDDREAVEDLYEFARLNGLGQRVVDHFQKAAKVSFKDPRWPQVLAWIAALDGDLRTAAQRLGEAVALLPQRLDLRERQAEAQAHAGDAVAAAKTYHQIWELSDHSPHYAELQAEQLALLGKRAEALMLISGNLPPDTKDPGRFTEAADFLARVGLEKEALQFLETALGKAETAAQEWDLSEQHAALYIQLSVRTGQVWKGFARLVQLEERARALANTITEGDRYHADRTASSCTAAIDNVLPEALSSYGTDDDLRAMLNEVQGRTRGIGTPLPVSERMARLAERIGARQVSRDVYRAHQGEWPRFRTLLQSSLDQSGLWRDEAMDMEQARVPDYQLRAAALYRRLGDTDAEERLLGGFYGDPRNQRSRSGMPGFSPYRIEVSRLLDLRLRDRKKDAALSAMAGQLGPFTAQTASQLLLSGRTDLGLQALVTLGQGQPRPLTLSRQGLALLEIDRDGKDAARAAGFFSQALSLSESGAGPIGRLRVAPGAPRPEPAFARRTWFQLTERYGQALALSGKPGRALLAAAVEDRPLEADAHIEEGDVLAQARRVPEAIAAYRRARTLAPRNLAALDRLARALWQSGGAKEQKEALRLWAEPLSWAGAEASMLDRAQAQRFDLLLATQVVELRNEAARSYGDHVLRSAPRWRSAERVAALSRLMRAYADRRTGSPFERFVKTLVGKTGNNDLVLLGALGGIGGGSGEGEGRSENESAETSSALLDESAREPYLRMGLVAAQGGDKGKWRKALSAWGLRTRHFDATLVATQEALTALREDGGDLAWIVQQRAQALLGKGLVPAAAALLSSYLGLGPSLVPGVDTPSPYLRSRLDEAIGLLRKGGRQGEADDLTITGYRKLGTHRLEVGESAALFEALMRRGQKAEAQLLLARMSARQAYGIAADLCERYQLYPEALRYRRQQVYFQPAAGAPRVGLVRALLRTGQAKDAATLAVSLLAGPAQRLATRAERAEVADLLPEVSQAGAKDLPSLLPPGRPGEDEIIALGRARLSGNLSSLRERVSQMPSPRYALGALIDDDLRRNKGEDALRDALKLMSFIGLTPELQLQAADGARRNGRHALALSLVMNGDPLQNESGPVSALQAGKIDGARLALTTGLAESARQAGFLSAEVRLLAQARDQALSLGQGKEGSRLSAQVRAEQKQVQGERRRWQRQLVRPELAPADLGAPPAGPFAPDRRIAVPAAAEESSQGDNQGENQGEAP